MNNAGFRSLPAVKLATSAPSKVRQEGPACKAMTYAYPFDFVIMYVLYAVIMRMQIVEEPECTVELNCCRERQVRKKIGLSRTGSQLALKVRKMAVVFATEQNRWVKKIFRGEFLGLIYMQVRNSPHLLASL